MPILNDKRADPLDIDLSGFEPALPAKPKVEQAFVRQVSEANNFPSRAPAQKPKPVPRQARRRRTGRNVRVLRRSPIRTSSFSGSCSTGRSTPSSYQLPRVDRRVAYSSSSSRAVCARLACRLRLWPHLMAPVRGHESIRAPRRAKACRPTSVSRFNPSLMARTINSVRLILSDNGASQCWMGKPIRLIFLMTQFMVSRPAARPLASSIPPH
jgi:hypothetical protein